MKLIWFSLVLAIWNLSVVGAGEGLQSSPNLSTEDKGSWLFHACQANIRTMDAADGGTDADVALTEKCIDYEEGVFDGALSVSPRSFCPGNATNGTMIRVYVNYMQEHPKLLDEAKSVGLIQAWIHAYPCPRSRK